MSDDFEYERRFYCSEFPTELDDGDAPLLIVQSYYVHQDGFALRIRTQARSIRTTMTPDLDALKLLMQHREAFKEAFISVKGRAVGGTRYEAERPIDSDIAVELMQRGGTPIIKNRYSAWIGEDGWDIDVFGGPNASLVTAEVERSGPVTNLTIPRFCTSEVTDDHRFYNDGLASRPYMQWKDDYLQELKQNGPHFSQLFGKNTMPSSQML